MGALWWTVPLGGLALVYLAVRLASRWLHGDWRRHGGDSWATRSPDFTSWEDPGGPE